MFKISVCSCGKAIDSVRKILQFANCAPPRVWYNDGILYKGGFSMRRTKALLSCLLALALVMLTACGAKQQTVHRLSADRVTQAATAGTGQCTPLQLVRQHVRLWPGAHSGTDSGSHQHQNRTIFLCRNGSRPLRIFSRTGGRQHSRRNIPGLTGANASNRQYLCKNCPLIIFLDL